MDRNEQLRIVQRLDQIECELFGQYRAIERLRLDLQREWRVLVSDPPATAAPAPRPEEP